MQFSNPVIVKLVELPASEGELWIGPAGATCHRTVYPVMVLPFGAAGVQVTGIWFGPVLAPEMGEVIVGCPGGVVVAATPMPIALEAARLNVYETPPTSPSAVPMLALHAPPAHTDVATKVVLVFPPGGVAGIHVTMYF